MSISQGDTVILPHGVVGYLHKTRLGTLRVEGEGGAVWDGYDQDDLICADDPLRVRVDTEQEAREVYDLAVGYWESLEPHKRDEVIKRSVAFEFDPHNQTFSTPTLKSEPLAQEVDFLERRCQVRKYILYHNEEETMSDLTHEPKHGDWSYECIHCGEQDVPITEECPEHPDRQREDNDQQLHHSIFRKIDSFGEHYFECMECKETFYDLDRAMKDNPCPARQPAEDDDDGGETLYKHENNEGTHDDFTGDDDDGEGDFMRYRGEKCFCGNEININAAWCADCDQIQKHEGWKSLVKHWRDHCELSQDDGVCEWTPYGDGSGSRTACGISTAILVSNESNADYCTYCGREIEITTDEGGGFEVGQLLKSTNEEGPEYVYVYGIETERDEEAPDYWSYPRYQLFRSDVKGGFTWSAEAVEGDYKRIGSFKPDDDALERVPSDAKGELVIDTEKEAVVLWPFINHNGVYHCFCDDATTVGLPESVVERTRIVLDFHQIAEVSDYD